MTSLNKDLLQEVIGKEYKILKITKHSIKVIHEEAFNSVEWCEHKVAHKCKEWASEEPRNLHIQSTNWAGNSGTSKIMWHSDVDIFSADSEVEAIFKACQWILDNKENK